MQHCLTVSSQYPKNRMLFQGTGPVTENAREAVDVYDMQEQMFWLDLRHLIELRTINNITIYGVEFIQLPIHTIRLWQPLCMCASHHSLWFTCHNYTKQCIPVTTILNKVSIMHNASWTHDAYTACICSDSFSSVAFDMYVPWMNITKWNESIKI